MPPIHRPFFFDAAILSRIRSPVEAALPKIGPWRERLESLLLENKGKPSRERLTLVRLFEDLRGFGSGGSSDAVRRYAISWRFKNRA
jgi:hypothetical protein